MNYSSASNHTSCPCHDCVCSLMPKVWYPHSSLSRHLRTWVFLIQFSFGIVGNSLNIMVLNSPRLRSRTNFFLSAMAVVDIGFFLSMFWINLSGFEELVASVQYMKTYALVHIPSIAFANFFSAVGIWMTVTVTIERLVAVRYPLHARLYWTNCRIIVLTVIFILTAFFLTLYHYVYRDVVSIDVCSEQCVKTGSTYRWTVAARDSVAALYTRISIMIVVFTIVCVPLSLLIVLNCCLIHFLRQSHLPLMEGQPQHNPSLRLKNAEKRTTAMVILIVVVFIVLNVPSGILNSVDTIFMLKRPVWFFTLSEISNSLVSTGKSINFALFVGGSSQFRKQLRAFICGGEILGRSRENSNSLISSRKTSCGAAGPRQSLLRGISDFQTRRSTITSIVVEPRRRWSGDGRRLWGVFEMIGGKVHFHPLPTTDNIIVADPDFFDATIDK